MFEQLALALKDRVSLKFFTLLNIRCFTIRSFEQLALSLKSRVALEFFTVLNMYFLLSGVVSNLHLPKK